MRYARVTYEVLCMWRTYTSVMARRTVYIPDAVDAQLKADLEHGDSYSERVTQALVSYYELDVEGTE